MPGVSTLGFFNSKKIKGMCKAYNCRAPSAGDYCVLHEKHYGKKPEKKKEPYTIPKQSEKKKKQLKEQKSIRDSLSLFYLRMIEKCPGFCIECDKRISAYMYPNPRTIVAHILCKRTFKSIAENETNIVYLCCDCHHRMDDFSPVGMKIFRTLQERVALLLPLIKPDEARFIPECFNLQ